MVVSETYLSEQKRDEFEKELEDLKTEGRKKIAEQLEYAKSLGDLSENAEYNEARDAQAKLEERISKIEDLLKRAVLVKEHRGAYVDVGSTVTIKPSGVGGAKETWHIVGSEESNLAEHKISNISPLGAALIGKKKGEDVRVVTPRGGSKYKIVSIG